MCVQKVHSGNNRGHLKRHIPCLPPRIGMLPREGVGLGWELGVGWGGAISQGTDRAAQERNQTT